MKKLLIAAAVAACWGQAQAQTAEELLSTRNTDNVLAFGMNPNLTMWSPLKQIDKSNVKRLVPVWSFSTGVNEGHQSPPLVNNGIMFVTTPQQQVYVVEVAGGHQRLEAQLRHGVGRAVGLGDELGELARTRSDDALHECAGAPVEREVPPAWNAGRDRRRPRESLPAADGRLEPACRRRAADPR